VREGFVTIFITTTITFLSVTKLTKSVEFWVKIARGEDGRIVSKL